MLEGAIRPCRVALHVEENVRLRHCESRIDEGALRRQERRLAGVEEESSAHLVAARVSPGLEPTPVAALVEEAVQCGGCEVAAPLVPGDELLRDELDLGAV